MAINTILTSGTSSAIDKQVDRILKDLGNPEPPLRLEEVRELLRLDLKYYSSSDHSWLQDKVHKMKVAGKQVLARPALMLDVVKKLELKALIDLDRKRIHIDGELPPPKQRWSEGHEIIHRVLPWHNGVAHGDQKKTLSVTCHTQIEAEANYGNGRLLFLGERFCEQLLDESNIDFSTIMKLKKGFGNTLTTTLWRVIENLEEPNFGLVSIHPQADIHGVAEPVRYFIRSAKFIQQFPHVDAKTVITQLASFCYGRRGPIGQGEIVLTDAAGDEHIFHAECFNNSHDVLTLGMYKSVRRLSLQV